MPTKAVPVEQVREEIAREAAQASGKPIEHFLDLLGPVEITAPGLDTDGWRLAHYSGTVLDLDAIEKAVEIVHHRRPIATRQA